VDKAAIVDALAPLAVATSEGEAPAEYMILSMAFLVDRDRLGEFDAAIEAVSRERRERMQFRLVGPLPPYSFVNTGAETAWV
jgi:hypothetical protein